MTRASVAASAQVGHPSLQGKVGPGHRPRHRQRALVPERSSRGFGARSIGRWRLVRLPLRWGVREASRQPGPTQTANREQRPLRGCPALFNEVRHNNWRATDTSGKVPVSAGRNALEKSATCQALNVQLR